MVPSGPPEIGDVPIRSKYKSSLAAYQSSDLGITAELKADCADATSGPLVPANSGNGITTLLALVNSQRAVRVQASLQLEGADVGIGECKRYTSGRSTAFDTSCRVNLPAPLLPGLYTLVVERRTRAGDNETDLFPVDLDTEFH